MNTIMNYQFHNYQVEIPVLIIKSFIIDNYFLNESVFLSYPYGQCLHPLLQQNPRFKWYFSVKTR